MSNELKYGLSVPMSFNIEQLYNSKFQPSTFHATDTALSMMCQRYLLQKAIARFEFDGIPEYWSDQYFKYCLFCYGYLFVFDSVRFGVIPQHCGLAGYDVFYRPTEAIVTNALLPFDTNFKIDYGANTGSFLPILEKRSGCLLKMQPDYGGVWDIVVFYANMMAIALESVFMNLVNSKFAHVFMTKNKNGAESFKKMFDQIQAGNPAVFVDKDLFSTEDGDEAWRYFNQNIKQMYISGNILEDVKKIEAEFNTLIGIPNVNIAKASGVTTEEVNANNADTYSLCNLWIDTMRKDMDLINKRFGLNLSVSLSKMEGGAIIGSANANGDVQL